MLPIGQLMIEHRIIDRMVSLLKKESERAGSKEQININLICVAVDFFKSYADRCHHGKEEDIMFKDLGTRPLSSEHKKMMADLMQDHARARELIGKLETAKTGCQRENPDTVREIKECLKKLVDLYTSHIKKEDKQFFVSSMTYFTKNEQDEMLFRFEAFDRTLIHEKYKKLVEKAEKEYL